ncbi:hypothetical protein U2237_22775 [Pseudomonas syringae pv. tomato]|nr:MULTISPECIES: hypothetical protein [Pseudomonas syringae group]MEA1764541.1 hypothetical protein [Pseudomonas syringae pv. tomato]
MGRFITHDPIGLSGGIIFICMRLILMVGLILGVYAIILRVVQKVIVLLRS